MKETLMRWLPLIVGGGAGSTLLGLLAYRMRAKIDVWRMTKQADVAAAQTPLSVLQQAIANRDKMLETANAKLYEVIQAHQDSDRVKNDSLIQVLTEMKAAMVDLTRDQRELREDSARRSAQNHEDLRDISTRLAVIETKVGLRGGA